MRKLLSIAVVLFAAGAVVGSGGRQAPQEPPAAQRSAAADEAPREERRKINWKADFAGPVTPGDSVIFLVGNFAAQHNGALIACDSAVQHSERHWEFFGNVLINKNTTYIYGDRADYDGDLNEAHVYSDLVKVVDGEATLYTYNFLYNTQTNVGEFSGGGYLVNGENRLESQRGYYFGDDKLVASVDEVQMRNEEYALKGDSVVYNLENDDAYFFARTNIWNRDGDYLYADRGSYRNADTTYFVTRNGYLLTEKQEMWSDSIDYFRAAGHIVLRHDLQLDDTEHKALSFGDYGEYWQERGDAFLTRRPAIVSYDTSQGDTLYMRSDSIYLFTINRLEAAREARRRAAADSLAQELARMQPETADRTDEAAAAADEAADAPRRQRPEAGGGTDEPGAAAHPEQEPTAPQQEAEALDPSSGTDTPDVAAPQPVHPLDTLTGAARKAYLAEQKRKEQAAKKAAARAAKKVKLDTIAARRKAKNARRYDALKAREERLAETRRQQAIARVNAARARAARKGHTFGKADPKILAKLDSLSERLTRELDSLTTGLLDTLLARQYRTMLLPADSMAAMEPDSIYRLVKGFRNAKIYRTDFQVVCDSITGITTDSTLHLYIDPVLWNENNQITADSVTAYTERQELVRAEFFGNPIMASELDTLYFNQIKGKTMTAYFRDNELYRNDVVGNAQTIYYMTDGEPPVVTTMGVIESGDLSFYFEEKELVQMTWRANPEYHFYPIIPEWQVPENQPLYLDGFRWEAAHRPTREAVFNRRIRPSEREARQQLAQPDFPIMQQIEAEKQRLIEARRWVDRNDPVDPATTEWMHDLGYEVGQPHPDYRRPAAPPAAGAANSLGQSDPAARSALPDSVRRDTLAPLRPHEPAVPDHAESNR